MNTYISDPNIREAYREDTVGRRYHTPIVSKNNSVRNEPAGECMTLNLNNPMTWNEFKGLSESLQIRYITHLRERYNVSMGDLARMFGCVNSTVYKRMVDLDIDNIFDRTRATKEAKAEWEAFLHSNEVEETEPTPIEEPTTTTNVGKKSTVNTLLLNISGEYYGAELLSRISALIDEGTPCKITIAVAVGDDNG